MKPTILLFAALMLMGGFVLAQDPVIPEEEAIEEPTVCEPYLRVNYEHSTQALTIFYEDCDLTNYYYGCFSWCGTVTRQEMKAMEKERNRREAQANYQLYITDLYGNMVYQYDSYNKPTELVVTGVNLEAGAYVIYLRRPGAEPMTHKFGVR